VSKTVAVACSAVLVYDVRQSSTEIIGLQIGFWYDSVPPFTPSLRRSLEIRGAELGDVELCNNQMLGLLGKRVSADLKEGHSVTLIIIR
jgi:hypothetical protein